MGTDNIRRLAALVAKEPAWMKDCQLGAPGKGGKLGKPLPNLKNTLLALRHDPMFAGALAFDLMECSAILMKPVAPDPPKISFKASAVTDIDIGHIQERLRFPRLSKDVTAQAIDIVAHEHAFHPIRSFLESLVWDGKPRVATWLSAYLGVARSEYADGVGKMFLISMVARVMSPGCKADSMLILEGPQGALKSSTCAVLAGEWFSDSLPDLETGKDCSQHLAGKWLCEFSEMHVATRADAARFKAFASRTTERYRRPYDRKEVHEPRQVVFVGTTNLDSDYLKDETGNRRFWPVRVGRIAIDALRTDRDQLLAEALVLFRAGVRWWPDKDFEQEVIVPEQEDRYEGDVWEEAVASYVKGKADVTIGEIATGAVGFESLQHIGTATTWRVIKILRHLGWTQGRRLASRRPWVPKKA
jgi:predicted P-loop ATPase